MTFNLRKTFFWVTIACVLAALLRRPILFAFSGGGGFFRYIWISFYPICWLLGCESWVELPPLNPHDMNGWETLGAVVGLIIGSASQMLASIFVGGFLYDFHQACCDKRAN